MTEERWRISVDESLCIGSAVCAGTVPSRFRIEGGHAVPVHEVIEPDDGVLGAAESCPMEAIRIVRVGTDEVLAPEV
ncbi:MAG TPA: ferredoxin [Pseudonocardiaceae bacterium]|nr:ferredoxin [Pseudonocardiaceae bacterium]